jgi:hypothetical protein
MAELQEQYIYASTANSSALLSATACQYAQSM